MRADQPDRLVKDPNFLRRERENTVDCLMGILSPCFVKT